MEAPAITHRRRPFLAPIWLPALLGVVVVAIGVFAYRSVTTTTIVLVRHAEKALGTIDVTNTRRSQQTAAPLAAQVHLTAITLPAADIAGTAARLLREHRGGTVLFVGHSNTLPQLIRELSGAQVESIPEDDFGEIYVLSVARFGRATELRMKY